MMWEGSLTKVLATGQVQFDLVLPMALVSWRDLLINHLILNSRIIDSSKSFCSVSTSKTKLTIDCIAIVPVHVLIIAFISLYCSCVALLPVHDLLQGKEPILLISAFLSSIPVLGIYMALCFYF